MQTLSNQTFTNTTNRVVPAPGNLSWYPFDPQHQQPTYYTILQGYCAPLIIIVSTVLNSLIAIVLLQKQLRSPTNILLLAIALYDTLTGLFPFPAYIYVYTFKKYTDYMPYSYGWFHRINYEIVPFIFHTCSIWVTVVLAIQRYIYVCYSEKAKQWCTVPMALKAVACVNTLAFIIGIPMFFEGGFLPIPVSSLKNSANTFNACGVRDYSEDARFSKFFSFYSVLRALLINVGPCTILVILNAILVNRMKAAKKNRERLIKKRNYENRNQEQTSVTLMLIIVVTIFLVVEVPMALHLIISGLLKLIESPFLSYFLNASASLLNFAVLLSYPINFFIYCRMSRAFRSAFTDLLCPSISPTKQERFPLTETQIISRSPNANIHNNKHIEININNDDAIQFNNKTNSSPTVILNATAVETTPYLSPSISTFTINNNGRRPMRVLNKLHEGANPSKNTKYTDL